MSTSLLPLPRLSGRAERKASPDTTDPRVDKTTVQLLRRLGTDSSSRLTREEGITLARLIERGYKAERQLLDLRAALQSLIGGCSYPRAIRRTLHEISQGTWPISELPETFTDRRWHSEPGSKLRPSAAEDFISWNLEGLEILCLECQHEGHRYLVQFEHGMHLKNIRLQSKNGRAGRLLWQHGGTLKALSPQLELIVRAALKRLVEEGNSKPRISGDALHAPAR